MWPRVAAASALLLFQGGAVAQDCPYTVSVLDVPGVQCVSAAPCSGTYYASGLSQGVGACPSGSSCALLPQTPIMGCAAAGRTDLIYVNADGTLTKDGKSVTLADATTTKTTTATTAPSTTSSTTSSTARSKSTSSTTSSSTSSTTGGSMAYTTQKGPVSNFSGGSTNGSNSNASSGSSSSANAQYSDGDSDTSNDSSNSTPRPTHSNLNSSDSSSSSNSWSSSDSTSGSIIWPGSSSANQQSFNPGSILGDSSSTNSKGSTDGLSLGAIIGIVVGCLAVVAIAAGARLLQKGEEAEGELSTPQGAAMEGYNGGEGGGSGMTPKENVLLL